MRLSHPSAIVALPFVAAAAIGVSCSFPEIVFFESTSGTTTGGGGDSAISSSTASTGDGATSSSTASTGGGGNSGASSSSSASSGATSSSSGGTNCMTDEDQDGAISTQCQGGTDCADHDFKAHPDPPAVSFQSGPIQGATAPNTQPYDFNCDGQETGETPVLDCQLLCILGGGSGYQSAVQCGASAALGHCETVTCAWKPDSPPKNRTQRCK